MSWGTIPSNATLKPSPFKAEVAEQGLKDFHQLVKLSKIGPETYENLKTDRYFGISRDWLSKAKARWENGYDWRKVENRINSYPNFTVPVTDDGVTIDVHFIALFSQKADAIPIILLHGWPGTILEFLDTLDILKSKYTPETMPYHIVVPSLPGYGYSSGPPLDRDYTVETMSGILNQLMVGLGFGDGYITQGGDIGSFISRVLVCTYDSCKACHLNLCIGVGEPEDGSAPKSSLSEAEQKGLLKVEDFGSMGNAYARMHGTRPATIGLVLSSSPVALLAWIGEKFLVWTDEDPSIDDILDSVTLYWFTDSFPRAIFPYRQFFGPKPTFFHNDPNFYIKKPLGYSWHPEELAPIPKAWVEKTGNLVWYKGHTEGGHFAAMEKPKMFVEDLEEFVKDVWPTAK